MKNFLLEHYRQVNEHLRETDRKRNILLGLYIPTGGILTLLTFPDSPFMDVLNGSPVIFVSFVVVWIIMGIFVFYGITIFRRWHIEFRNVTIGIHRAFVNGDYDLFKAMRDIIRESDKFGDYYNLKGTQIVFPFLVLLNQVVLPLYACFHYWNGKGVFFFLSIAIILTICCVEYWFYRWYLKKEESRFKGNPAVSWCILPPKFPEGKRREK